MTINPAVQENPSAVKRVSNFFASGLSMAVSATTSSAATAFPFLQERLSFSTDLLIYNSGTVPVFIAFGDSTITAVIPSSGTPANGICIAPGAIYTLCKGTVATYIAAITGSSTAILYISQGYGS